MIAVAAVLGFALSLQYPENPRVPEPGPPPHTYSVPMPTDSSAVAVRAMAPPVIDGKDDDAVWRTAPADHGVQGVAAHRGEGPALPHRGAGGVRRREPLRLRPRLRPAPRQHHPAPRAARHLHAVGHDLAVRRLVPRPAHRLRVRRQRRRREDRRRRSTTTATRTARGTRVWDVATRIDSLGWTAEFRIPLSQLRYGTDARAHLRLHDRAGHLPLQPSA